MKPTDKQVVEWARKAGVANAWDINWFDPYYASFADLAYKAGAKAEREACGQIAHDTYEGFGVNAQGVDFVKERIIAGIRARGNHE
jgi:hypothetical protein